MAKYLIETTETYRVDTEQEAEQLINESKASNYYELDKYVRQQKELKQKGEVVDSWFRVTLKKKFTSEKEPNFQINISYED